MFQSFLILIFILLLNLTLFKNNQLVSEKLNLFDKPDFKRKLHLDKIALNGGIFFFLNIFLIFLCDFLFNNLHVSLFFGFENEFKISI